MAYIGVENETQNDADAEDENEARLLMFDTELENKNYRCMPFMSPYIGPHIVWAISPERISSEESFAEISVSLY